MGRILLHLYGPFAIYSYGFFIAIAALLFAFFMSRDSRFKTLNLEPVFSSLFIVGMVSILFGGRILHLLAVHDEHVRLIDLISFWEPGFSILGSVIAVLTLVPLYLRWCGIPVLVFIDLVATYAGLLQGVSRLGCFFAGCCFGQSCSYPWSVLYTDPDSSAPLYVAMHPVQLYSFLLLMFIFLIMYFIARKKLLIDGQQTALYVMLCSLERFIADFWRGDRDFFAWPVLPFSIHQLIALGLFATGGILMIWVTMRKGKQHHEYQHIRSN